MAKSVGVMLGVLSHSFMEIMPLGCQGTNDGEEFSVVDVIISFCWREWLGKVGAGVPVAIWVNLEENSTRGILGGISCYGEGGSEVWEVKDRFRQEKGFEGVKWHLTCRVQFHGRLFLVRSIRGQATLEWSGMKWQQKLVKPRKDLISLTFSGVGQLVIPSSLMGSMASGPDLTIILR